MDATEPVTTCHRNRYCFECAALCLFLVAIAAVLTTVGCGGSTEPKPKPTAEEIDKLRSDSHLDTSPSDQPSAGLTQATVAMPIPTRRELTVKETVVDSLGRIGIAAVPALIEALSNRDAEIRANAARALAAMGSTGKDAVPALIERLDDADEEVRRAAARALGQMGPDAAAAVPTLISIIKSPTSRPTSTTAPANRSPNRIP